MRDRGARHSPLPPWQRSWLYRVPGKGSILAWLAGLHALALIGLVLAPAPSPQLAAAAILLNLPGALGLTLAFHRGLAHRAVELHPLVEQVLIFLAMFNGFGTPASWAAEHRVHHRFEDTERDISSPVVGGFWWGHLRWLWQAESVPETEYPPRLREDRYLRWQRWQPVILALALGWPIFLGFTGWVWFGPVRLVYALHAQMLVNSATHMGEPLPGRGGTSRNLAWLAFVQLLIGESWHRNHHIQPGSARIGMTWWQIDLGWLLIRALGRLGLATQIRQPSRRLASAHSSSPSSSGRSGLAHHSSSPPS